MPLDLSDVKEITIPQGNVKRIATLQGDTLWEKAEENVYFYVEDLSGAANTLRMYKYRSNSATISNIEVSTDGTTWTNVGATSTTGITVNIPVLGKLFVRATTSTWSGNRMYISRECAIGGNLLSLIYGRADVHTFDTTGTTPSNVFNSLFYANNVFLKEASELKLPTNVLDGCYNSMFMLCSLLHSTPKLPATTLADSCYRNMFYGCINLQTAPALRSTTLASNCYNGMFYGCTSLVNAPSVLPATTLTSYCYNNMFSGCLSLTTAPSILATTLAEACCMNMFNGCTSLTNVPALQAQTMASQCCQNMFYSCTSLVSTPILPAITLAYACYNGMFQGCTSLTTIQSLPATTLASYCYNAMFMGCTSLTSTPALPATVLPERCYSQMFSNCINLTEIPSMSAATVGSWSCYQMFYNCSSLTSVTSLPATTLGNYCYNEMFRECSGLVSAPAILATTLGYYCCKNMFYNCTSLVNVPTLPVIDINTSSEAYYCFSNMFEGCTSLVNAPVLPSTTLTDGCYGGMFRGCTSLTNAPSLPVTTLATSCYSSMFQGCTSLTNAPSLPATTLATSCYSSMFQGCTSLTNAPSLPATVAASYCYSNMFRDCTSLVNVPSRLFSSMPEGADMCCSNMFSGCTSLVTAPDLPATTLCWCCYDSMFSGCTSLVNAPDLPATTLGAACYTSMFSGCTSLITAPELPATTLVSGCYQRMFEGCTSLTTAPVLPATTLVAYCYYYMFIGCSSLNYVKALFTTTPGGSYTSNWLDGVAATGTFVKGMGATWDVVGANGVPSGWTVALEIDYFYVEDVSGSANIVTIQKHGSVDVANVEVSTDQVSWTNVGGTSGGGISINLPANSRVFIRCVADSWNDVRITSSSNINVGGNIHSLLYGDNAHLELKSSSYLFKNLFSACRIVSADDLLLISNTLTEGCYYGMFSSCDELIAAPELVATTMVENCYQSMFQGCTNLVTAPELPATELAERCYDSMFAQCTSLVSAPELPATELSDYCYYAMFFKCTSLVSAPELPATTLVNGCYGAMFQKCSSLNYIKAMFRTTPGSSYTSGWVNDVAATGIFLKDSHATWDVTGDNGVPTNWSLFSIYDYMENKTSTYANLGVSPDNTTTVQVGFSVVNSTTLVSSMYVCGSRNVAGGTVNLGISGSNGHNNFLLSAFGTQSRSSMVREVNKKYVATVAIRQEDGVNRGYATIQRYSDNGAIEEEDNYVIGTGSVASNSRFLSLFAYSDINQVGAGLQIYSCKVLKNDAPVLDLIPVIKHETSTDYIGFFNRVDGSFINCGATSLKGVEYNSTHLVGNRYTFYNYIQNKAQVNIDTGVAPDNTTKCELLMMITNSTTLGQSQYCMGSWTSTPTNKTIFSMGGSVSNTKMQLVLNGVSAATTMNRELNKLYLRTGEMEAGATSGYYKLSGTVTRYNSDGTVDISEDIATTEVSGGVPSGSPNIQLFAYSSSRQIGAGMRIYHYKIWKSGVLLQELVPAIKHDGGTDYIGFLNLVDNTFISCGATSSVGGVENNSYLVA